MLVYYHPVYIFFIQGDIRHLTGLHRSKLITQSFLRKISSERPSIAGLLIGLVRNQIF